MTSPTFFQIVVDMAAIIADEGIARNRDQCAARLLDYGHSPRMVAAFLDLAILAAQTPRWADLPVAARETFRGLR
jgi:hypothetical protein